MIGISPAAWKTSIRRAFPNADLPVLLNRNLDTKIEETALFTEATWDITDQWSLVAGLRAFKFQKRSQPRVFAASLTSVGTVGLGPRTESKESDVIGRVIGSYKFREDSMIYLQAAQGYRPGGINDLTNALLYGVDVPEGFDADKL